MRLSDDDLRAHADQIGLNMAAFLACRDGDAAGARVASDGELAQRLGVRGTPTFFAGRVIAGDRVEVVETVAGARPIEDFERAISRVLEGSSTR
jgi:predicted DsbA family dithiol-disulfide isomerase